MTGTKVQNADRLPRLKVDGIDCKHKTVADMTALFLGPVGSSVVVKGHTLAGVKLLARPLAESAMTALLVHQYLLY